MRYIQMSAFAAALLAAVPGYATPTGQISALTLATPSDHTTPVVTDLGNNGRLVGTAINSDLGRNRVVAWNTAGSVTYTGTDSNSNHNHSNPLINGAGEIAFTHLTVSNGVRQTRMVQSPRSGTLPRPSQFNVNEVYDLNEGGSAVGWTNKQAGTVLSPMWIIWRATPTSHNVSREGIGPAADSINDDGDAIGRGNSGNLHWMPQPNQPVTVYDFGRPSEIRSFNTEHRVLIKRSNGLWLVADLDDPTHDYNLPQQGTLPNILEEMNEASHIVGTAGGIPSLWAYNSETDLYTLHALSDLLPSEVADDWSLQTAEFINDDGLIYGMGSLNGVETPYLLAIDNDDLLRLAGRDIPFSGPDVPIPGGIVLALSGLLGLTLCQRRRRACAGR